LNQIYLRATNGPVVPLSAVAKYEPTTAPIAVNHQGQFPSVTLSFNLTPGVALSDAVERIAQMEQTIGMPGRIHGSYSGTLQAFQSSLASTPFLIITALAVFISSWASSMKVHPSDYHSFHAPSAGVGAVWPLAFQDRPECDCADGILLLIGIVKKKRS